MIRFNDVSRQVVLRHELEHLATTDTLTDTNEEQAKQVAEKVRKNIAAQRYPHKGKNIMYTTSIGIAIFNDFALTTPCCEIIIQQADACLYKAKEWGRNQTVCWTDLNQQWQN